MSSSSSSRSLAVCVLAAGKGTRMKSARPKVLATLAGAPLVEYVLDAALALDPAPARTVMITGYRAELVEAAIARMPWGDAVTPVRQEPQLGTGHAVQQAMPALAPLLDDAHPQTDLLVLLGDVPMIRAETLQTLLATHREAGAAATILSMEVDDPTGYGRLVRAGDGRFVGVVEHKDATDEQRQIREVSTGIFCFDLAQLKPVIDNLKNDNAAGEYYLPDVIPALLDRGQTCAAVLADDPAEVAGINSFRQLAGVEAQMRERLMAEHMDNGVHIVDPASTYIEKNVEIGADTVVFPYTVIRAGVRIGAGCEVGPFSHLRVGTRLHDTAEIGNFVECKKAEIGPETKAKHLTYLGDVTIGTHTNVGAGTVICNYDGKKKHHTDIGSNVFIGSGSMIVAPRKIADGGRTGAGSVVTKDVADGQLVVGAPARPVRMPRPD
jgi:bifunctional UDP-N-acetylglucosamine pyrophosphorylase/glucosamine-1-phosphate N-acetyltransferase